MALQGSRLEEADALLRAILAQWPEHPDALHLLGVLRLQQGRDEAAAELFRRAVAAVPGNAAAWLNLGLAARRLGRGEEALSALDRALELRPDHVTARFNRGTLLLDLERPAQALECFDGVLNLQPGFTRALVNRGIALLDLGRPLDALASFDRALAIEPGYPEALNDRGVALQALRRHEEALASFERAIALRPAYAEAMSNRADALDALGRDTEAIEAVRALVELAPGYEFARGKLYRGRQRLCEWTSLKENARALVESVRRGEKAVSPFVFLATTASAEDQLRCARIWASTRRAGPAVPESTRGRTPRERIRVAYLSADFREHATSFLAAGLFEKHDRARFDTIAVSFAPKSDGAMARRLGAAFGSFLDVADLGDLEVSALLREREVDIAVDLMGYTLHARPGVLASRPAPVQVNYLGFPGTMGADWIDYILADEFVIPGRCRRWYAEKVVALPDCFQVNDDARPRPGNAPSRREAGLPETGLVFCSFNDGYKLHPDTFGVWMRLLAGVGDSVLWLVVRSEIARENLRREAAARGISPQRLVFAPDLPYAEHLARLGLADIALDTLPYNSGTTASDALWCGVPLVTCPGEAFASRMAGSILRAARLPELIAGSLGEYEAIALALARDPARRARIRASLLEGRSSLPLFDTDRFRRHLEHAYAVMWERHLRGEPPEGFAVAPLD